MRIFVGRLFFISIIDTYLDKPFIAFLADVRLSFSRLVFSFSFNSNINGLLVSTARGLILFTDILADVEGNGLEIVMGKSLDPRPLNDHWQDVLLLYY